MSHRMCRAGISPEGCGWHAHGFAWACGRHAPHGFRLKYIGSLPKTSPTSTSLGGFILRWLLSSTSMSKILVPGLFSTSAVSSIVTLLPDVLSTLYVPLTLRELPGPKVRAKVLSDLNSRVDLEAVA